MVARGDSAPLELALEVMDGDRTALDPDHHDCGGEQDQQPERGEQRDPPEPPPVHDNRSWFVRHVGPVFLPLRHRATNPCVASPFQMRHDRFTRRSELWSIGTARTVAWGSGMDARAGSLDEFDAKGHRARLRQRLLDAGPAGFHDYELLEYLLTLTIPRVDTKPLAKRLLHDFGGIGPLLGASADTLRRRPHRSHHCSAEDRAGDRSAATRDPHGGAARAFQLGGARRVPPRRDGALTCRGSADLVPQRQEHADRE